MKKISKIIVLSSFVSAFLAFGFNFSHAVQIYCDGSRIQSDQEPTIVNSRVYVPVRVIAENFGAKVDYDKIKKAVDIQNQDTHIHIIIGENDLWMSDKEKAGPVALDAPVFVKNGRTMLPLRAISEIFDMKVDWNNDKKAVYIDTGAGSSYLKDYIDETNAGEEVIYKLKALCIADERRYYAVDVKPYKMSVGSTQDGFVEDGYSLTIRKDNEVDENLTELVGHYFINKTGTLLMEYDVLTDSYKTLVAVN